MTVSVPLSLLAIDNEKPQPGDPIDLTASGKLESIDGETANVTIETVNGAPIPADGEQSPEDMTEDEMRGLGEKADALPFGNP